MMAWYSRARSSFKRLISCSRETWCGPSMSTRFSLTAVAAVCRSAITPSGRYANTCYPAFTGQIGCHGPAWRGIPLRATPPAGMVAAMTEVTRILHAIDQGHAQAASQLLPLVYTELRKLAAQKMAEEAPGKSLQPTH